MSSVRVLILGAGAMARKHALAYQTIPDVAIAAVANRGAFRGQALAAEFGIPTIHNDYLDAITRTEAEIVSVCVPTALHPELAIAAMNAGSHVITEKPIALNVDDALRMIDVSRRTDRKLTVVFNRRFNTVWDELRRRLDAIGTPLLYNTQEIRSVRPKPAMHSISGNGGPVIDCCVHDFDMLLQLFGRPRTVYATGRSFGGNKAALASVTDIAIDTAHISVEFEGDHQAQILYAWGFPEGPGYWQYREFMGPDGIIRLMGEYGERVEHYRRDGRLETVTRLMDDGHLRIIRAFVDAVVNDGTVPVAPEDALAALEVSLAAMTSIRTEEPVVL